MAISKRLRYEVLRRDNHSCRYCGKVAPETELTIDHVTPKTLGGTDDPSNLVAACKDCNAGKSSSNPDQPLIDNVSADALRWAKAIAVASDALMLDYDRRQALREQFLATWNNWTYRDWKTGEQKTVDLPGDWANTVDRLLVAGLPIEILCESVNVAMGVRNVKDEFRYMCGVAWNRVADLREIATEVISADVPRGKHHKADGQPV